MLHDLLNLLNRHGFLRLEQHLGGTSFDLGHLGHLLSRRELALLELLQGHLPDLRGAGLHPRGEGGLQLGDGHAGHGEGDPARGRHGFHEGDRRLGRARGARLHREACLGQQLGGGQLGLLRCDGAGRRLRRRLSGRAGGGRSGCGLLAFHEQSHFRFRQRPGNALLRADRVLHILHLFQQRKRAQLGVRPNGQALIQSHF